MIVAIVNLGQIVFGSWRGPFARGDTIIANGETEADFERVIKRWRNALQVGTAGEPRMTWLCAVAGSTARVCNLEGGVLYPGKQTDTVALDAPEGGKHPTALAAVKNGDVTAIGAVATAGIPLFVECGRNTLTTARKARFSISRAAQDLFATTR